MSGTKHDGSKPNLALTPIEAIWAMGESLSYGAKKYGDDNFREGLHVRRQLAAALRHVYQALEVEDVDAESGCLHLGNAMASIAMAIYTIKHNPQFDNRYFKVKERELNELARLKGRENE
jgi:hypothetical protein